MHCNCRSKQLYHQYQNLSFIIDGQKIEQKRKITEQNLSPHNLEILKSIYENSSIYLPTQIDKISAEQIYASPLWFYKNYISMNKPCVIVDAVQMDVLEKWAHPKEFAQMTHEVGQVSISVTPDGFADSIKNQYFIEPLQIKANVKDLINWKQEENNVIQPDWIPYIQHQNSNLTEQFSGLSSYIDKQMKDFISNQFFEGNEPDASNFWMGYENSVSAIHKDPYENFYTTIVGEKHFTLLPPISICFLHERSYKTSKWKIDKQDNTLVASTQSQSNYETTKWIATNPDLQGDWKLFPELENLKQNHHHVVLEAGETLYLPSMWYHQVSQTHEHSPYTIALNYWFDMSFSHNYSLYEACRKLKGYN